MSGVRMFRSVGLRASACSFVKNPDFKWHTPSRLYSAFTFTRPVSFVAVTFTSYKWPWLWLRRVVTIAAELFLRRSRDRGGVKIADGLLLRR